MKQSVCKILSCRVGSYGCHAPAEVAFWVSSLTCAWSSAILSPASRRLQAVPQLGHTVVVVKAVAVAIREVYVKRDACGVLCVVTCAVAGLRKGKWTNGLG